MMDGSFEGRGGEGRALDVRVSWRARLVTRGAGWGTCRYRRGRAEANRGGRSCARPIWVCCPGRHGGACGAGPGAPSPARPDPCNPPPTHAHALSRSTWGVGVRSCACTLLEDPPTPSAPPVLLPGAPPESGGGPDCLPPPPSTRALAPLRRISCMLWRRWTYTSRRMRPRAGRQRAWRRPWWPSPHRACLRGHPRRRGQVGAGPGVDRGFHLTRGRLRRPCASARASRL